MTTDTPKTDTQSWDWYDDCTPEDPEIVPANFARELERENALLRGTLGRAMRFVEAFEPVSRNAEVDWEETIKIAKNILSNDQAHQSHPTK